MTDIKIQLSNYLSCCCHHVPPGAVSHRVTTRAGDTKVRNHEPSFEALCQPASPPRQRLQLATPAAEPPEARGSREGRVANVNLHIALSESSNPLILFITFCLVMCRYQDLELHVVKSVVEAPLEEVGVAIAILQGSVNVV